MNPTLVGTRATWEEATAEWAIEETRSCCAGTNMVPLCLSGGDMFVSTICRFRIRCTSFEGGVSHGFCMQPAPFGAARTDWMVSGACAGVVFAVLGRVCCSQRVIAFVGEGMNTLRPTGLLSWNETPVGALPDLVSVSNAMTN